MYVDRKAENATVFCVLCRQRTATLLKYETHFINLWQAIEVIGGANKTAAAYQTTLSIKLRLFQKVFSLIFMDHDKKM